MTLSIETLRFVGVTLSTPTVMRYMTLSIPAHIAVHDFINDGLVDKAMYRTSVVDGLRPTVARARTQARARARLGLGLGRGPGLGLLSNRLSIQGAYICGHFGGLNVN